MRLPGAYLIALLEPSGRLSALPQALADAKAELLKARGSDFRYEALLGDRQPALDYRKPMAAQR